MQFTFFLTFHKSTGFSLRVDVFYTTNIDLNRSKVTSVFVSSISLLNGLKLTKTLVAHMLTPQKNICHVQLSAMMCNATALVVNM